MLDIDSKKHTTRLSAIKLVERIFTQELLNKLIEIISGSGLSREKYELKSAAVRSLATIGYTDAIPELEKILRSKSLFHFRLLTELKIDIVRSMVHYPMDLVGPILEELSKANDDVARQASKALDNHLNKL